MTTSNHTCEKSEPRNRGIRWNVPSSRSFLEGRMGMALFLVVVLAIIVFRFSRRFEAPFLFAEDGAVFFTQNLVLGFQAIWTPYAGYLHMVPRIIAYLSGWFPVESTAYCYTWFSFLILLGAFAGVFKLLGGGLRAWIPGLAMALLPDDLYFFLNPTTLHWFLGFSLCCFALGNYRPTKPLTESVLLLTTLSIGLTGPFAVLLWPTFAIRCWALRDRWSVLLLAGQTAAAGVQLFFLLQPRTSVDTKIENLWLWIGEFGAGIFLGMPGIEEAAGKWLPWMGLATVAAYCAIMFVFIIRSPDRQKRALRVATPISAIIFVAAGVYRGGTEIAPWGIGERYFMIPYLLVFLSLADVALSAARSMRAAAIAGLGLAYLTFVSVQPLFSVTAIEWEKQVRKIPAGGSGFVKVWPESANWEVFVAFAENTRNPLRGDDYLRRRDTYVRTSESAGH